MKMINTERSKLETEIAKLQSIVDEVKLKEMNASLSFKSYEHVLDRMKKD